MRILEVILPKIIDIEAALATVTPLRNRGKQTSDEEANAAFATLEKYNNGAVFTGSFDGESPWERHRGGDELVHILKGEARLTILSETGEDVLELKAGMLTVVPKSCWHRFNAPNGVTVLTVTPQPTDHSDAEDPRLA
jgi:quercetin dioxygenase-like cupin family protein